ncbi:MAG: maleylpyruvate isomerase N-terminal domain-containing protein [Anaerolineae bacterium]
MLELDGNGGDPRELMARLEAARAELRAAIAGLSPSQMDAGHVLPGYTVKDLLGIIAAWDHEALAALEAFGHGDANYRVEIDDVEAWNAQVRDRRRPLAPMQVQMDCLMVRGEIVSLLTLMPPHLFEQEIEYPWGERGSVRHLIEAYMIANDKENSAAIREWRAREGV